VGGEESKCWNESGKKNQTLQTLRKEMLGEEGGGAESKPVNSDRSFDVLCAH